MGKVIPYIVENKIHVWNHQPDNNVVNRKFNDQQSHSQTIWGHFASSHIGVHPSSSHEFLVQLGSHIYPPEWPCPSEKIRRVSKSGLVWFTEACVS